MPAGVQILGDELLANVLQADLAVVVV